jgi:hypothetical protein
MPNEANILIQLTQAIVALAQSNIPHQPPPPPPDSHCTKVHEPDQFDGLDQKKLRTFLVQCQLNFRDRPQAFNSDRKKVTYAQSYLTGSALDWFEPDLLRAPGGRAPPWENDWERFVKELRKNFGSHNPAHDAEHQLKSLVMKDNHRINKYIVEFNRYASQLRGYGEGALQSLFYDGLPDRLKDEIYRSGRPDSLWDLRDLAQELDNRYWERRQDIARTSRSNAASSAAPSSSSKPVKSDGNKNSATSSSLPSSAVASGSKTPKDKSSGGKPTSSNSDLSSKLGKDGKLTPEERQRRVDNKLCLFCGKPGHMARDCRKSSSNAAKARTAIAEVPDAENEVSDETKN